MKTGEYLAPPTIVDRVQATRRHLEMSLKWKGERLGVVEMRRHYSNYFRGIPHFKEHRMALVTEMDPTILFEKLDHISDLFKDFEFNSQNA